MKNEPQQTNRATYTHDLGTRPDIQGLAKRTALRRQTICAHTVNGGGASITGSQSFCLSQFLFERLDSQRFVHNTHT
ncbi:hypothetical protein [Acetobacter sacchari]|uniref:hypothetical protein n=1 Tax=Acetobacter sacchari TaxID=2661687 RepID=UPI001FAF9584|nr:hypothetical protein [Acetobacter sacchari]